MLQFLFMPLLVMSTVRDIVDSIVEFLSDLLPLESFVESGYEYVMDLPYLALLGGMILAAVIAILGIISLVKKLTKIIIVLAIIIAIGVLYQQGVFGGWNNIIVFIKFM